MQIMVNGVRTELPDTLRTISDLLAHFELGEKMLVVERNGLILESGNHDETGVSDGDSIEIVHFVGGG
ncbi:sulfur carrier protein ThiS [Paenibacillus larvae subsp. larvae]|uniref:Sulfur carrier protein ThiS n=2 Tax=Paenibacillus larvae TaxID=1464 RepID=A0A2L1UIX4_9BACL|nr:sulfur carrier protein ThiS [Paenibacillus larvae]AQT84630.1 thiamine biosynthesis protein ThiS [Paenibacillus larvae subsp. pulvifaciens]AQZ46632.1 thiamine biosynthesis protein ThiS [Paenibacillus larvae subsp. pulvifaciens]AVF28361.1 sulfur carrier protein ThiS [Paenibacillus larvae subsp. larvae]AVF32864.1 sulfur carrier protein ThiS [Paenibacillus larvae subsp. larvae]MBH0340766.1 thiamine biosynthesis protein ThiS [Paenibacillus larvae]